MIINHNLSALFANRQLGVNEASSARTTEKLSSGQRINRAGDDASGLAVSEKLRAQIRGLNQASRNVANGVSFIQTTEGYLDETTSILQRLRELSVQSANGIYSDEDRMMIQVEVSQLVDEIDRIASHAQFNGMNIMTGRFAKEGPSVMQFQIGANMDQNMAVYIGTMTSQSLGLKETQGTDDRISMGDVEDANRAIGTIDSALKSVTRQRADLGAYQNRMEMAKKGIDVAAENLQASESRIRDADIAIEMVKYTKDQILQQAATAMLVQSNISSDLVLKLLQ
jgi:flagellin